MVKEPSKLAVTSFLVSTTVTDAPGTGSFLVLTTFPERATFCENAAELKMNIAAKRRFILIETGLSCTILNLTQKSSDGVIGLLTHHYVKVTCMFPEC